MKRISLFTVCVIIVCVTSSAQTSTQRIIIKGGNSAWDNFMKEVFRYPSFESGIVEYKNGQRYKSIMNYNNVLANIEFIDEKGDTLAMANEETISSVKIGNDVFVYRPECLLEIKTAGNTRLYKNEKLRIADNMKTGGYGIPNTTGTIDAIDRFDMKQNYKLMDINESLLLSKVTTYFIENDRGETMPASKKNILLMYPKHEEAIKSYIKSNGIDLSKENHLSNLTDFLSKL